MTVPDLFSGTQSLVGTLLYVGAIGFAGFALFDVLKAPVHAFPAAGKKTKNLWLAIVGIGTAVLFVTGPLNIIGLAAVVGAAVYVVDVRPAVRQIPRRGEQEGPYGPW